VFAAEKSASVIHRAGGFGSHELLLVFCCEFSTPDPSSTTAIGVDLPLVFSSLKLGVHAWNFVLQLHPVEPSKTFSCFVFFWASRSLALIPYLV
jgi:hypothetical protein